MDLKTALSRTGLYQLYEREDDRLFGLNIKTLLSSVCRYLFMKVIYRNVW